MKSVLSLLPIGLVLSALAACGSLPNRSAPSASAASSMPASGEYDNHEQVWSARERNEAALPPHVVFQVEPAATDWIVLRVRLDAAPSLQAVWALRRTDRATWVPHRATVAVPATGAAFDAQQWAPLDACALHAAAAENVTRAAADLAACTAIVPGLGAQAALLPIAIDAEGEWLRVRLYADQARGADARSDARRVGFFDGWAAINGAGPRASADNRDWHMHRDVRIGSEGGQVPLRWRDGNPSGYSLRLERLTYRDGNVPVLKLSVVDDADGHALAYAWANPEATRIGVNLGWVQVGLERVPSP